MDKQSADYEQLVRKITMKALDTSKDSRRPEGHKTQMEETRRY